MSSTSSPGSTVASMTSSSASMPPLVITISRSGSKRRPVRSARKSAIAARRSMSPVNGSQLLAVAVSSPRTVSGIASGGSGRSVSRFSIRSTGQSSRAVRASAATAVRSIPKPCTSFSRCARLNTVHLTSAFRLTCLIRGPRAAGRPRPPPPGRPPPRRRRRAAAGPHGPAARRPRAGPGRARRGRFRRVRRLGRPPLRGARRRAGRGDAGDDLTVLTGRYGPPDARRLRALPDDHRGGDHDLHDHRAVALLT